MGSLLLRSLGLLVLFEALGIAMIVTAPRRRVPTAMGLLIVIAVVGASQGTLDPALVLASAVLAGTLVGWAVHGGRGVWTTAVIGMLPVVVATTVELTGGTSGANWNDLRAQIEQVAGVQTAEPGPAPDASPEEKQLAERSRELARLASTWALRLVPMEVAGMALLQVLPLVAFGGAWARRRGTPVAVPPMARWEVPFAAIWALAAGLALVAIRQRLALVIGVNLVALVALWFAVQGFAVGLAVLGRGRGSAVRGMLLLVATLLAWPFMVSGFALLGALDLWVDFRRLRRTTDES